MTRAHIAAVLTRLRAHPQLTSKVFYGTVPTGVSPPYVTVFTTRGPYESERLDQSEIQPVITFVIKCIGLNPDAADWGAERVEAQLLNWRPTVAGFTCWRMKHESSQPSQIDHDVEPEKWYAVDSWDLRSTPA